ncbi:MAG: hypothetical protein CMP76_07960 [Flavobacterium sp.]|uniref:hypothetical protein n=1 Tax=Flavobacterium sp. TaxID=239 RepID=UPI000C66E5D4|nr:hypothetical protein [Flavobacterium sp.]MBF03215.1 hypothetical protein [Flavobacterium sp.]|tara:strand:- start:923 stop:1270 length:348 start_codon:yes stop_codon:yes gene_type:complete
MKKITEIKASLKIEQEFVKKQRRLGIKKGVAPAIKKIRYYSSAIKYLETMPNEKWLLKKKEELQKIIRNKLNNYDYWLKHCCTESDVKKQKNVFNKENDITKLRQQVRFISFLLK